MARMATHPQRAETVAADWRLTEALNAKLAELAGLGFEVQWIEASRADIARLLDEGGDEAIQLDPDPAVDRAWFGAVEIRYNAARELTWVFVRGEVASGEVSAHVIGPPDPPA